MSLAEVQHEAGLINKEELADLRKNEKNIDIEKIFEIEKETRHDVVAGIREFAGKAKTGGGKIHLGATSMDVTDNADAVRIREAGELVEKSLKELLGKLSKKIETYSKLTCLGLTHLQPAEPTTVGYRLAFYGQDLMLGLKFLRFALGEFKAKGIKGAVGTGASFEKLLEGKTMSVGKLEKKVMKKLGLKAVLVSSQVYPRQFDFLTLSALASIGAGMSKLATDLRLLQNPSMGEWSEPFGKSQVGSSAMPFKKNPISSEKICSLSRFLAKLPQVAWENAALSWLERSLDDSANRRIIISEGFLAVDEILRVGKKIISGLVVNERRIGLNLEQYGIFSAVEVVLMEVVKKGGDRQRWHEELRKICLEAGNEVKKGKDNPLREMLVSNKELKKLLSEREMTKALDISRYIGEASKRALRLVKIINREIAK